MANQEKDHFGAHEQLDSKALEKLGSERQDALRENLERGHEHEQHISAEKARSEALEQASHPEREHTAEKEYDQVDKRQRTITKDDRTQSFNTTMKEVRDQLSPGNRAFSKIIHQPTVEKMSDAVGNTIARPNAILTGSIFAFLLTATIYLVARFNGYPLSGSETIASFVLGWLIGLLVDYIRLLVIGKR